MLSTLDYFGKLQRPTSGRGGRHCSVRSPGNDFGFFRLFRISLGPFTIYFNNSPVASQSSSSSITAGSIAFRFFYLAQRRRNFYSKNDSFARTYFDRPYWTRYRTRRPRDKPMSRLAARSQ